MESKKNPNVDPRRNSLLFFQVGLVAILLLTYLGIEMKTEDPKAATEEVFVTDNLAIDDEDVVITLPPVQKLPPPPPPAPEIIEVIKDEIKIEEKQIEKTEVQENKPVVVTKTASEVGDVGGVEDLDIEVPFAVIEQVPLFPGCEKEPKAKQSQCFQQKLDKFVKDNYRVPDDLGSGYKARVSVVFIIDKAGNITDVKAVGGNSDLQKEAYRVFGKAPKLMPGKQRGAPVKCKFTYPITIRTE